MAYPSLDPADTTGVTQCTVVPPRYDKRLRSFGFIPEYADMLVGDLVLYSAVKPGFLQRSIHKGQLNSIPPDDAMWTHASVYIGQYTVCEAVGEGVRVALLLDSIPGYKLRFRRPRLQGDERWRLAIKALSRLRSKYSWASFGHSAISLFSTASTSLTTRRIENAAICSQVYADAFAETTGRLITQVDGNIVSPGDLSVSKELDDVIVRWAALPK